MNDIKIEVDIKTYKNNSSIDDMSFEINTSSENFDSEKSVKSFIKQMFKDFLAESYIDRNINEFVKLD